MLGGALELAEIFRVWRAAGEDHFGIEPVRAHAGQSLIEKLLRLRPAGFGRVQHKTRKGKSLRCRDLARERDGLRGRLDSGALAPGIALDDDRERAAGGRGGLR